MLHCFNEGTNSETVHTFFVYSCMGLHGVTQFYIHPNFDTSEFFNIRFLRPFLGLCFFGH